MTALPDLLAGSLGLSPLTYSCPQTQRPGVKAGAALDRQSRGEADMHLTLWAAPCQERSAPRPAQKVTSPGFVELDHYVRQVQPLGEEPASHAPQSICPLLCCPHTLLSMLLWALGACFLPALIPELDSQCQC